MKKSVVVFIGALLLLAVAGLVACGQSQNLPEPAVDLPVALGSFTQVKYGYDPDLGDYQYQFKLTNTQQIEFQKLLQADQWFDPGELPGRGYTPVIDADDGQGWNLTVGYWDEAHTLIGLYSDDQDEKIFYFAPFEVQEAAGKFRDKLEK